MPTYTNSSTETIFAGTSSYIVLLPGENVINKYLKSLPENITFTSHEPIISPWVLLETVTSTPMLSPVNVFNYNNIIIYNASDDYCTLSANTDDSNALILPAGSRESYDNNSRKFGCIEILSMGSGSVYIYGL